MKRLSIAVSFLVLLSACASWGDPRLSSETKQTLAGKIFPGKTNEENVRTLFGEPEKTSYLSNGDEEWQYNFYREHVAAVSYIPFWPEQGTNGKKKNLVIEFTKNKIVKRYNFSESEYDTRQY